MATYSLTKPRFGIWLPLFLFGGLLVSLTLMSDATHHSEQFSQMYSWLLLVNALGLIVLVALIGTNLFWMVSQYRARAPGALLRARLVVTFVVLAVVPIAIVYYFSLQFLQHGIDSWFNVEIEQALEDSLDLSRGALDLRLDDLLEVTEQVSVQLTQMSPTEIPSGLYDLRVRHEAIEYTLFGDDGRIVASSQADNTKILPSRSSEQAQLMLAQQRAHIALDPFGESGLNARALVLLQMTEPRSELMTLQAIYKIPDRLSGLAENVQSHLARYKELAFLRKPLKYSYTLTLSLVLMLSLLSAVWAAFFSARRLVQPIGELANATRAVAEGDYSQKAAVASDDELGFLVSSFNDMTGRLAQARDQAYASQQQIEEQRAYLETVLGSLSSGVMSIDGQGVVTTANDAACDILYVDRVNTLGARIGQLAQANEHLSPLVKLTYKNKQGAMQTWQAQIALNTEAGLRELMCRSTALPDTKVFTGGQVLVFDDVTELMRAQRESAWGEVARRLAHEIKNPLTPIQLSAERLRRKYLKTMTEVEGAILDRATHTIVQQVESLKEMVNAFSDYARAPNIVLKPLQLNDLLLEVLDLYNSDGKSIKLKTAEPAAIIEADVGRLRQLMHNLIKNALESISDVKQGILLVETHWRPELGDNLIELSFEDNGGGFAQAVLDSVFEPYVTNKARGTGLGMAVVKKIVEEHDAKVQAFNTPEGAARVEIVFNTLIHQPTARSGL